jgi:hypothetical protein
MNKSGTIDTFSLEGKNAEKIKSKQIPADVSILGGNGVYYCGSNHFLRGRRK